MNHDTDPSNPASETIESPAAASRASCEHVPPGGSPPPEDSAGLAEVAALGAGARVNFAELDDYIGGLLALPPVEPWPEPVDGCRLLDDLLMTVTRFAVLPKHAPETVSLWVPHTYGYQYRDVTTYIGLESPEHRCGKSTLITILSELAQRAVVASNVTAPSFFRVIARIQPTLLIDEADTFLSGNDELRGIINSSYFRKTAFVLRAINPSNQAQCPEAAALDLGGGAPAAGAVGGYRPDIVRFSCWCPKVIARIGPLPTTLADRCIIFRMHRKTAEEQCERLRKFSAGDLKRKCLRFVLDHAGEIAAAEPALPRELNDRAADIWEPLFVIADLAGGPWPARAREAAVALASASVDSNPKAQLLFDLVMLFGLASADRMFSGELVKGLAGFGGRPWSTLLRGKPIDERWLARQLHPYGIRPRNLRIAGVQAKGYYQEEVLDMCRRYVGKDELRAFIDELKAEAEPQAAGAKPEGDANGGAKRTTATGDLQPVCAKAGN